MQPRSCEVQTVGKVYVGNRRHLRKHEPNEEDVEPAVDSSEITVEAPNTTDKGKSMSPESHQGESEPPPENGSAGPSASHDDKGYRTRSGRLSVKPARFNDFVMD